MQEGGPRGAFGTRLWPAIIMSVACMIVNFDIVKFYDHDTLPPQYWVKLVSYVLLQASLSIIIPTPNHFIKLTATSSHPISHLPCKISGSAPEYILLLLATTSYTQQTQSPKWSLFSQLLTILSHYYFTTCTCMQSMHARLSSFYLISWILYATCRWWRCLNKNINDSCKISGTYIHHTLHTINE